MQLYEIVLVSKQFSYSGEKRLHEGKSEIRFEDKPAKKKRKKVKKTT